MIKVDIENLRVKDSCHFIFICQKKHVEEYGLRSKLTEWAPGADLVVIDGLTEGAACTVLLADKLIDNTNPLMIANSDQFIDIDINSYIDFMKNNYLDGLIMTMSADDPKWSFVDINESGFITRVVEKEVISNEATVGIYNFKKGSDFIRAAKKMIQNNDRTNNEFYVAPVYNYLIKEGYKTGFYNIGSEANGMYGLGTPKDLRIFLEKPISKLIKTK